MASLQNKFNNKDFAILSISIFNDKKESEKFFKQSLRGKKVDFPVLFKGRTKLEEYGGTDTPSTFIIDRNGKINYRHTGFSKELGQYIEMEIETLLNR
jgi:peroxiredoxin